MQHLCLASRAICTCLGAELPSNKKMHLGWTREPASPCLVLWWAEDDAMCVTHLSLTSVWCHSLIKPLSSSMAPLHWCLWGWRMVRDKGPDLEWTGNLMSMKVRVLKGWSSWVQIFSVVIDPLHLKPFWGHLLCCVLWRQAVLGQSTLICGYSDIPGHILDLDFNLVLLPPDFI